MKCIIAGGRNDHVSSDQITEAIAKAGYKVTEVISGAATGIDSDGEKWATAHSIPTTLFPALWDTHGKKAGPIRNKEMASYADCLIAFWNGKSPGTKNMIDNMRRLKKPIYIVEL